MDSTPRNLRNSRVGRPVVGPLAILARTIALILLPLLFASCSTLQSQGGKTSLWRVRGAHHTVYLMGSVHALPRSAYPLKPAMEAAFDDADRLVMEVDVNEISERRIRQEIQNEGMYPKGDSLKKHLSPKVYVGIMKLMRALGADPAKAERMRPWLIAQVIRGIYLESIGFRTSLGLDEYFKNRAERVGKPIAGLEKLRDQTAIFSRMTDREAEAYLLVTIAELPKTESYLKRTVRAWKSGDEETLAQIVADTDGSEKGMGARLFRDRNRRWLPQVLEFLKAKQDYLVIVGVGHLVGPDGLVSMLRKKGFAVEQL